jgi:hypothetical protein
MNSHWIRGYGDPPPKTVIVVGMSREFVESAFESCQIAGHVSNRFGIENSVIRNTDIFLCHSLRQSWPLFWQGFQYYGWSVLMKGEMQRVQQATASRRSALAAQRSRFGPRRSGREIRQTWDYRRSEETG